MIFRQLFDATSSTYTYLLGCQDTRDAVLIDPVYEQHARDTALIRELDLTVRYVLDTHVHADHVTGAWLMREALKADIVLSARYGVTGSTYRSTTVTYSPTATARWQYAPPRATPPVVSPTSPTYTTWRSPGTA